MDVPLVGHHQDILEAVVRSDGKTSRQIGRRPLRLGDGGGPGPLSEGGVDQHITPSLTKYAKATYEEKLSRVREAIFLKTWSIPTTTIEPVSFRKRNKLWTGLVPLKFLDDVLLIRNVGLTALGSFTSPTAVLAANLNIAHQVGT